MLPVSAAELLSIQQELVAAVCDKTCQIWRKTGETRDVYGTQTPTWTQIHTTVCGMAQPSAGQLSNYDYLIASLSIWQVHLPLGTDVMHADHLVIGTHTLEVQVLLDLHSYPGLLTVLASEVG